MNLHDAVYTTSYDLSLYWSHMRCIDMVDIKDFFWNKLVFDPSDAVVYGRNTTRIHYLHGGIHLWQDDHTGENGKWSAGSARLLDIQERYGPTVKKPGLSSSAKAPRMQRSGLSGNRRICRSAWTNCEWTTSRRWCLGSPSRRRMLISSKRWSMDRRGESQCCCTRLAMTTRPSPRRPGSSRRWAGTKLSSTTQLRIRSEIRASPSRDRNVRGRPETTSGKRLIHEILPTMTIGEDARPDGRWASPATLRLRAATRLLRFHLEKLPVDYGEAVTPDRFLTGLAFMFARNQYACAESMIGSGFGERSSGLSHAATSRRGCGGFG